MNVQTYLRGRKVPFNVLEHHTTFTAQRLAGSLDVPGDNVAKTVVVKADGKHYLVVLQATHEIEWPLMQAALNTHNLSLTSESEFQQLFPDCELGAIPPFGSEYGMETIVDEPLTHDEYIVFEGNTHREAISMRYQDYARIENPQVAAFSHHI